MGKQKKTQKQKLLKYFPELSEESAGKIDIEIKSKIYVYEAEEKNNNIANFIWEKLSQESISNRNRDKIKKKCRKLAAYYIENNRIWILQENWYCMLGYLISIATMILRVIDMDSTYDDKITFAIYLVSLFVWIFLVVSKKFMGKDAEIFLNAFNHQAPSMIFVSNLIFYSFAPKVFCEIPVIIFTLIISGYLTLIWYFRMKRASESKR